jgi:hypothetical protein
VETGLVIVKPDEFGLEATEAAKVESVFVPMLAKMNELEAEFNEVLALPIEPTTIQKAHALRLKYVKVRTGTAEIHKTAKAYYLAGGKFVDAWKNAQAFASQGKEAKLEEIEKHFERLEAARKAKLKEERLALLVGLCETPEMYPVSEMSQPAFDQLLQGLTLAKKQKEDAERKAEEDRIAKEKAEAEERERIRLENERLRAEAVERERLAKEERERQEKILAEERAKAEAERKQAEAQRLAIEEQARKDREAAEAASRAEREKAAAAQKAVEEKARKEREASELKAKAEREKQARILAEQKAKAEAEKKAAEEKLRQERLAAQARADAERQKQEKALAEQKEIARKAEEKARLEKEELERRLADLIKCPKCQHEFSISQTKGNA